MLLFILSIGVIIFCLILNKSRIWAIILSILLFVLFGFSYGMADETVYLNRYMMYSDYASITEPLYTFVMYTFNRFGFTYNDWLLCLAFCYVLICYIFSKKFTHGQNNFALTLLAIFPFCLDVTQQRNTSALIFLLIALIFLLYNKEITFKRVLWFCLFVIIASGFHIEFIIYLFLLVPILLSEKKAYLISVITFFTILVGFRTILSVLADKNETIQKLSYSLHGFSDINVLKYIFIWLAMAMVYIVPYNLWRKNIDSSNLILCKKVYLINMCLLAFTPVLYYEPEFYRFQQNISLLNYCALYCIFKTSTHRLKINKHNLIIGAVILTLVLINLYILVLSNMNLNTVFWPLFENNTLF